MHLLAIYEAGAVVDLRGFDYFNTVELITAGTAYNMCCALNILTSKYSDT